MTRIRSAPATGWTPGPTAHARASPRPAQARVRSDSLAIWRRMAASSEEIRWVGTQDEGRLEQEFVDRAGRAEPRPLRVLVAQPEAKELRREEAQVRSDGPLVAGGRRILGPVVTEAEHPPLPGLDLGPDIEAVAVALLEFARRHRLARLLAEAAAPQCRRDITVRRGRRHGIVPVREQD